MEEERERLMKDAAHAVQQKDDLKKEMLKSMTAGTLKRKAAMEKAQKESQARVEATKREREEEFTELTRKKQKADEERQALEKKIASLRT
jgi:hypothetical protein